MSPAFFARPTAVWYGLPSTRHCTMIRPGPATLTSATGCGTSAPAETTIEYLPFGHEIDTPSTLGTGIGVALARGLDSSRMLGDIEGDGDGLGLAVGVWIGVGVGVGLGDELGDGLGLGDGVGVGVALGVGVGDADGLALGLPMGVGIDVPVACGLGTGIFACATYAGCATPYAAATAHTTNIVVKNDRR